MTGPSVLVHRLSIALGRRPILRDVSLSVAPGEALGLVGPNGAGKTTLVGCLLGLLRPDSGSVLVDGRPPDAREVRRRLGHVPERPALDRGSTPRAELRLHHALAGRPRARRVEETDELLRRVGLDERAGRRRIHALSKGMQQRLAFAIGLVAEPSLLVLDEPFSGVDPAGVALLRGLIDERRRAGATLVLNSHRIDQVALTCDRVVLLADGRSHAVETPARSAPPSADRLEHLVVAAAAPTAAP
jgi:ABC-2 type transport system ATP-binding protein